MLLLAGAFVGGLLALVGWRGRESGKLFSGSVLVAAAFGTDALIEFFKFLFDRTRPPASLQMAPETGLSFPSGHAAVALAVRAVALY